MRETWERKKPLVGWDTKLTWIKSGTSSRVFDTPFEIYMQKYGPTLLSDTSVNTDVAIGLTASIREKTLERKLNPIPEDSTVEVLLTIVAGRELDSASKAKKNYRARKQVATFHTLRYELKDLKDLSGNIIEKLDIAAQLPSKPSWLVVAQATIRLDMGKEDLLRKGKNIIHKVEIGGKFQVVE